MNNRRQSRYRIWIARLAIACVLFQVLASGWHGPLMAMSSQLAAGPTSQIIVICSPSGVRLIVLDRDGNPMELPKPLPSPPICSICSSVSVAAFATLPDAVVALSAPVAVAIAYADVTAAVEDRKPYVRCGLDPPHMA